MKHVQLIRESTANANARIGAEGEVTIDTDQHSIRVHDGVTAGGHSILNEESRAAIAQTEFSAVTTESVPGALAATVNGQLLDFTVAGTYTLPAIATAVVGQRIVLHAIVAGVVVAANGAELIQDGTNLDAVNIALAQYQVVQLSKKTDTHWIVMGKY